jgi:transcriptional regulator with XRE-family HTH domain
MFGQKLKELRKELNLLQTDIAKILDVSVSTIGMYEQGRRNPDTETLDTLANFFDVSVDYLLGRTKHRKFETEHTAFHTTSVDGLDEEDIAIVENLIKSLKAKHKQ